MEGKRITSQASTSSSHFATFLLAFLLFISSVEISSATDTTKTSTNTNTNYLKTACSSTTDPKLCYNSLFPYASTFKTNDLQLCNTALTVSLKAANSASKLVKKISKQKGLTKIEAGIVKTCIDQVADAIYELKQSMKAMRGLKGPNADFQFASIKTWVSAAITDESTCTDELDSRKKMNPLIKSKIAKSISKLAKLTSNALDLVSEMKY